MNASAAGIGPVPFYCWNNRSNSYSHPNKHSTAYRCAHARPAALCASSRSWRVLPPATLLHRCLAPISASAQLLDVQTRVLCACKGKQESLSRRSCAARCHTDAGRCAASAACQGAQGSAELSPLSLLYFGRAMLSGRICPPKQPLFSLTKAISFSEGLPAPAKHTSLPALLCYRA